MFGDFIALGFDQIVNGIAKFREMYDEQVTVPLVVRTPMGGGRGYGPTHSQSLEKLLLGVPNIGVVATSECHDLRSLLVHAVEDEQPVFFIENKLMYGRPNRRPVDGYVEQLRCVETDGPYPALTFSGSDFTGGSATVVTYGGMLPVALAAATELILEQEIFCEVVALSRLLPLDLEPVLASVARTGALLTLEEGTLTGGVGAEIAARVQEHAWGDLRRPVRRIAARDGVIPSARRLEDGVLPGVADVVGAVLALEAVRA
jgi:pyruvate/2-oxoglutarate/acetoin dehydrogenase E1 component